MKPAPPVTNARIAPPDASIGVDTIGIAEGGLEVSQNGVCPVPRRDGQLARWHAPIDAQRRIVPRQAAFRGRIVVTGDLVDHLTVGLEGDIAVSEAWRHPDLTPVVGRKLDRDVAAERRRAATDVHRDIEDRPGRAPNEFSLRVWLELEVQAAQYAARGGQDVVVLHEMRIHAVAGKRIVAIDF